MASRIIHIDVEYGPALRVSLQALNASLQAAAIIQESHPYEAACIAKACEQLQQVLNQIMPNLRPSAS